MGGRGELVSRYRYVPVSSPRFQKINHCLPEFLLYFLWLNYLSSKITPPHLARLFYSRPVSCDIDICEVEFYLTKDPCATTIGRW